MSALHCLSHAHLITPHTSPTIGFNFLLMSFGTLLLPCKEKCLIKKGAWQAFETSIYKSCFTFQKHNHQAEFLFSQHVPLALFRKIGQLIQLKSINTTF